MKILVTSLPDLKKIPPQRYHHLLRCLSQKHEITALCVNAWWLEERQDSYLKETLKGIRFVYLSERRINPVLQELSVLWDRNNVHNELNLSDFDVHINFNSLIAGYSMTKRLKALGIPTIFDICDDLPERIRVSAQIPALLRPLAKQVGNVMMAKGIRVATKITYVTKSLGDSYAFHQEKSVLIPNGVDTELFLRTPFQNLKEELGLEDDDFVIGFVGVLSEWVDLEPSFIAVKELVENGSRIKMVVVGGGERLQYFKNLAEKYNVSKNVIFTGSIPYTHVPKYVSCMDCCLISLRTRIDCQNCFPLTLLEYMACEKPVISTALAGVKEAVGNQVLYASNVEELKGKMLELYNNDGLRRKLGHEGRGFVEQNHSWAKIGKKFEEVLIMACENGGAIR